MKYGTILAMAAALILPVESVDACTTGTPSQRERWAIERQDTLDALRQVKGYYRQVSSVDGEPDENGMVTTTIRGTITKSNGKKKYDVVFYNYNDIGVCRWSIFPHADEYGIFYLEKPIEGVREITHFEKLKNRSATRRLSQ